MNTTPRGNRIHIGIFGKTNSGKSLLINRLSKQETSLVSDKKGTTTDPVYKAIEIHGLGPCVLIDTAGFNDDSSLGAERIKKTEQVLEKIDIALLVFSDSNIEKEKEIVKNLLEKNIKILPIINKIDEIDYKSLELLIKEKLNLNPICVSALLDKNVEQIINTLAKIETEKEASITGHLIKKDDIVLLIMPQDIQAPKGRLILPQVQTIRDLLDNKCVIISCTSDNIEIALNSLKKAPKLIICDSQVFKKAKELKPQDSILTSFSVLFAKYKGDIETFIKGATSLASLNEKDVVLIAEACTHNALDADIGRVKIPTLLKKKYGISKVEIVSGNNFPEDLSKYSLIIHCGSCMFNKKHVLSRIEKAKLANVPITNYGLALAFMNNIFDSITY